MMIFARFITTIQGLGLQQILSMWTICTQVLDFGSYLTPGFGDESKEESGAAGEARGGAQGGTLRSSKCFSRPLFLKLQHFPQCCQHFSEHHSVLWKGTGASGWKMPSLFLWDMSEVSIPSFQGCPWRQDHCQSSFLLPPPLPHYNLGVKAGIQNAAERGLISSFASGH